MITELEFKSLAAEGYNRYLAAVVRGLRKSGARLIVLDIDLRRPTSPADDRALAAPIRGIPSDPAGPVVVARTLTAKRAGP